MNTCFLKPFLLIALSMVTLPGIAAPGLIASEVTDANGQFLGYGIPTPSDIFTFIPSLSLTTRFDLGGFMALNGPLGGRVLCEKGQKLDKPPNCISPFFAEEDCTGRAYSLLTNSTGKGYFSSRDRKVIYRITAIDSTPVQSLKSQLFWDALTTKLACGPFSPSGYPQGWLAFTVKVNQVRLPFTLPVALPLKVKYQVQTLE